MTNTVNTRMFLINKADKVLAAEISTLQISNFKVLATGSEAVGLDVVSHVTGRTSQWEVINVIRDPVENETLGWYLKPTVAAVAQFPHLAGYSMVIDND